MEEYKVRVEEDGTIRWYQNGKLHRLDSPAIEWTDGEKYWFKKGKLHRIDGPAAEYADGRKFWYIEGEELTEQEFLSRTQTPRKVTMKEVVEQFGENVVIMKESDEKHTRNRQSKDFR